MILDHAIKELFHVIGNSWAQSEQAKMQCSGTSPPEIQLLWKLIELLGSADNSGAFVQPEKSFI